MRATRAGLAAPDGAAANVRKARGGPSLEFARWPAAYSAVVEEKVLCGALRSLSSWKAPWALEGSISVAPESRRIPCSTPAEAPANANRLGPSCRRSSASTGRAERTGPIWPASLDCQVANSRVRPPSTGCSTTTSAVFRPACGRATAMLSIFTDSAGRPATAAPPLGRPVSGKVAGAVVVVDEPGAAPCDLPLPPQPASSTSSTTSQVPSGTCSRPSADARRRTAVLGSTTGRAVRELSQARTAASSTGSAPARSSSVRSTSVNDAAPAVSVAMPGQSFASTPAARWTSQPWPHGSRHSPDGTTAIPSHRWSAVDPQQIVLVIARRGPDDAGTSTRPSRDEDHLAAGPPWRLAHLVNNVARDTQRSGHRARGGQRAPR